MSICSGVFEESKKKKKKTGSPKVTKCYGLFNPFFFLFVLVDMQVVWTLSTRVHFAPHQEGKHAHPLARAVFVLGFGAEALALSPPPFPGGIHLSTYPSAS
jgi:hypothetical protein